MVLGCPLGPGVFLCCDPPQEGDRIQIHPRRWKINGFNTKNTEAAQNVRAASWHQRARFQTTRAECCSGVTPAPEEGGVLLPGCPGGQNSVAETTSTDILPPCAPSLGKIAQGRAPRASHTTGPVLESDDKSTFATSCCLKGGSVRQTRGGISTICEHGGGKHT